MAKETQKNTSKTNNHQIDIPELSEDLEEYDFDPKARLNQLNKLQRMVEGEQILLSKKRATGKVKNNQGDIVSVTVNGLEKVISVKIPSTMPGQIAAPMVLEATNEAMSKIRKKSAQGFSRVAKKVKQLDPVNLRNK